MTSGSLGCDGGVTAAAIEKVAEQKPTAADFAKAEFARHPDGRVAARTVPKDDAGHQWLVADTDATDLTGPDVAGYLDQYMDSGMARSGWSPVRECPNPEVHEGHDDLVLRLRYRLDERDASRDMAALWKETAREHVGRSRTALSWAEMCEEAVRTATDCAEKAERVACPDKDVHWRYDEAITDLAAVKATSEEIEKQLADAIRERDEARATKGMHKRRADEERARADEAEPRSVEVTDAMVGRTVAEADEWASAYVNATVLRAVLTAALTVPTRPEGAEEIEAELIAFEDTEQPHTLSKRADFLASRGVRVEGSGR